MDKKILKDRSKSSKEFQKKANLIHTPSNDIYEIYEPHLPKKQTTILESLIMASAMMLTLICALVFHYYSNKKKENETKKKFIPIIVRIVNSAPSFRNGKSYYFFTWEDSLEYTNGSSSCFAVSTDNHIWKIIKPQVHQRYFFGIRSLGRMIKNYGVDSHYFEKDDKIKLLGKQCYFCSFTDFDSKNKPEKCHCSCNEENWQEKHKKYTCN